MRFLGASKQLRQQVPRAIGASRHLDKPNFLVESGAGIK